MDKLRKILGWVWFRKEQMVLLVMVGFLCYRVYEVMYPPEEVQVTTPIPPRELPADPAARTDLYGQVLPPSPPPRPPMDGPEDVATLYRRHPFWYSSSVANPGDNPAQEMDIQLLQIQQVGNRHRAWLRVGTSRRWLEVGAQFAGYTLEEIDPDARTVTVYARNSDERVTLNEERAAG